MNQILEFTGMDQNRNNKNLGMYRNSVHSLILKILIQTTLVFVLISGCTDVMEKKNLEKLLADDMWEDPYLIKGYMDKIVRDNLPGTSRENHNATEEYYSRYGEKEFIYDGYNIDFQAGPWSYEGIRNINKFLENVDKCPADKLTDELKAQYKAQLLTLRGLLYFNMVRVYGGIPLILHEQSADEDLYVKRTKTSECIAQIIKDFDDAIAIESFPMRWTDGKEAGRISKAFTYALKGRVLLYYASPQFSKTIGAGTKSAAERWNEAYAACKEAKDKLATEGYALFKPSPADFDDAVQTFYDLYFTEVPDNPEVIGVRRYDYPADVASGYDNVMRPSTSGGSSNADASLEYANAFLNADGTPFTALQIPASYEVDVSLTTSTVPFWIGREPRFYAFVAYNGCIWSLYRRNPFREDLDETGKMRHQWVIEGYKDSPYQEMTTTQSGSIRVRKMVDVTQNYVGSEGNRNGMDWILCRYAEVLLNFAETAVKTGHDAEAMEVLQTIRRRAGIPQGTDNYGLGAATGDNLLVLILKERLLELSHEGDWFRFFDVRRWRLYTDDIAGYTMKNFVRHTIRPRLKTESPNRQAMAELDVLNEPDSYFEMFEDHIYALDNEPFTVSERQYFYNLSFVDHIRRNPNLEQTKGWEGGTFDPYE
ncbi:MAG: RagB/SusD family nutrient uptake outer membrane protein [Prevotellaceae bacterium]|jgi:hypothetical protein|nr:RagB/SusD family nutrient uptake outer membrane protein [Prevotellaceae bacterium]